MRREKLASLLRRLLIAALLVSAVLLARETGYYRRAFDRVSGTAAQVESHETPAALSATELVRTVRPRAVLVRSPDGSSRASAYAGEETEEAFRLFSAILGEVLGSAGEAEPISEELFRAGMETECVFFDFFCELPLGALAQWLGSEMGMVADAQAQCLYLSVSDVNVALSYRGADGGFYRCASAAVSETLRARMEGFAGCGAHLAYTDALFPALAPYTVLLDALPEIIGVNGVSAFSGTDTAELLQTVGMNRFFASSYTEADGTKVFIESEKTLRFSPDGALSFRAGASDGERQAGEGVFAAVNYAYALAVRSIGRSAGEADVLFSGVSEDAPDCYTVTFDYCLNCIPLRFPTGNAAKIVLRNGHLAELELRLRSYAHTDTPETVLPMRQAAAIANAARSTPALIYADSGSDVKCTWVKD